MSDIPHCSDQSSVKKERLSLAPGLSLQPIVVRTARHQERKASRWMLVLSSLSLFYAAWNLSLWDGTTHTQGRSFPSTVKPGNTLIGTSRGVFPW